MSQEALSEEEKMEVMWQQYDNKKEQEILDSTVRERMSTTYGSFRLGVSKKGMLSSLSRPAIWKVFRQDQGGEVMDGIEEQMMDGVE